MQPAIRQLLAVLLTVINAEDHLIIFALINTFSQFGKNPLWLLPLRKPLVDALIFDLNSQKDGASRKNYGKFGNHFLRFPGVYIEEKNHTNQ